MFVEFGLFLLQYEEMDVCTCR